MGNSIQGEGQLMGRLIRQIFFSAALCLALPALSGAQTLQNSGSGELNTFSLDLTQATVTLNRLPVIDAVNSSVTVDPPVVAADGIAFSTITVTLRDGNNQPVAGRTVSVASSRGALDVIIQPLNPTDANGETTAEIRSVNSGLSQVLATDGNVRISDTPAPVLAYVAGTAKLDGVAIADPALSSPQFFDIGDVLPLADANGNGVADPGESGYSVLTYSMIVGAGARAGDYTNLALAVDVCDACAVSAPVTADLEIGADPVFDLGTIIGKVFQDLDGDGWQDSGETGIGGAMVALDNGVYALTDTHGRYHFPAVEPGQRMVKLNVAAIAASARTSGRDRQVLSVTPGLLAKANFGVTYDFDSESIGADGVYGSSTAMLR
jgi:hypothetical protein